MKYQKYSTLKTTPTSLYITLAISLKRFFEHPLNVGGKLVKHPIRKTDRRTD